ncbi:MAG TPA: NUDIX domain-containing protein [Solirubrobacteraceae bacterium]|nr:NUDIX domain-containing protein [Solirubrobacteraceae bacterium]
MPPAPGVMARGPWDPEQIRVSWRPEPFQPTAAVTAAADEALDDLRRRGSPSHDGLAARLSGFVVRDDALELELEPVRWSIRLVAEGAAQSLSALTVVRAADGRWLAGRRAAWLASWAGRWALGAGGAVEVDENPAETMIRELDEEWSVVPERLTVEALVRLPTDLILMIGLAWLPADAPEVTPDAEHDTYAWWPADVDAWPQEADETLRRLAAMLTAAETV